MKNSSRGQALLLVLWGMLVMSFSIMGLVKLLQLTISTATTMEKVAVASSTALAGVAIGRNDDFPPNGRIEKQKFAGGSHLEVSAVSENSKLNINKLLEDEDRKTLRWLFRHWGLSDVEADTVLDCLQDYIEPGPNRRLNGAKTAQYRAAKRTPPTGKPFRSVEEMASVLNFELVTRRKPEWRDYFTIYGNGKLDLLTAPPDLIKAICRIGDSGVNALISRRSRDGVEMKDIEEARQAMGLTTKEFGEISGQLIVGGKIRRVRATGEFHKARRTIEAVCNIEDGKTTYLEWREW